MRKVKVAQAGLNGFGRFVTKILLQCENIELIGGYDIDAHCVAEVADALKIAPYYTWQEALASPCEGVVLVVPNNVHAELVKSAAMAGKHIFVEKPIANTRLEAEEIIHICKKQGVLLQVGHSMRFMNPYRKARALIRENAIGRIVLIEANYSSQRAKRHTIDVWRFSRETCPGGPMLQLGIHCIDTIHYLTGSKPLEVRGLFTDSFTETQNDDAGCIIMKLENNALAYVGSSYISPKTQQIVIYGDDGKISMNDSAVILNKGGRDIAVDVGEDSEDASYRRQFEGFSESIRNNTNPEVDGETGLIDLEVVLAALKSGACE
jgi:predicted dehydrogenase